MTSIYINGKKIFLSETLIKNVNKSLDAYEVKIKNNMHISCDSSIIPKLFYKINDRIPLSKEDLGQIKYIIHDKGVLEKITSDGILYILSKKIVKILKVPDDSVIDTDSFTFEHMLNHINNPFHRLDMKYHYDFHRIFNHSINSTPDIHKHNKPHDTKVVSSKKFNIKGIYDQLNAPADYMGSIHNIQTENGLASFLSGNPQVTFHKTVYKQHTGVNIFKYYPSKILTKNVIRWSISNEKIKKNMLSHIVRLVLIHDEIDNFTQYINSLRIYFSEEEDTFEIVNLSGTGIFVLNELTQLSINSTHTEIPLFRRQGCLYYGLHEHNYSSLNIELTLQDNCKTDVSLLSILSGLVSSEETHKFANISHEELVIQVKEYTFVDKVENINDIVQGVICAFIPADTKAPQYSITNFNNALWRMDIKEGNEIIDTMNKKYSHDALFLPNAPIYVNNYCLKMFDNQPNGDKTFKNVSFVAKSSVKGITKAFIITHQVYRFVGGKLYNGFVNEDAMSNNSQFDEDYPISLKFGVNSIT